ncbi:MAG: DUF86 domain-containing protein [Bacteroidota bacterium]|jgi:uncharacterized protein with HEPN domain
MSKRVPGLLVADMIESAEKIISYTDGFSLEEFINDDKTVDAVIRNFEIIGEAANRLPDEFKTANPQIEWSTLRGFRNRIVHDYFGIDYSIVWNIIKNYLPGLLTSLKSV